jgi:hypothetical protein
VMWYRREERERDRSQPGSPLLAAPGSCSRVEDLVQPLHSGGVSPALEVGPANPAHAAQIVAVENPDQATLAIKEKRPRPLGHGLTRWGGDWFLFSTERPKVGAPLPTRVRAPIPV